MELANSKPWIWAAVIAELVRLSVLHLVPRGQIFCFVQVVWWGWGEAAVLSVAAGKGWDRIHQKVTAGRCGARSPIFMPSGLLFIPQGLGVPHAQRRYTACSPECCN